MLILLPGGRKQQLVVKLSLFVLKRFSEVSEVLVWFFPSRIYTMSGDGLLIVPIQTRRTSIKLKLFRMIRD